MDVNKSHVGRRFVAIPTVRHILGHKTSDCDLDGQIIGFGRRDWVRFGLRGLDVEYLLRGDPERRFCISEFSTHNDFGPNLKTPILGLDVDALAALCLGSPASLGRRVRSLARQPPSQPEPECRRIPAGQLEPVAPN